jgi:hypothetical protein
MSSEWMKVMLDEIARKESEAEEARLELERRAAEQGAQPAPNTPGDVPPGG